MKMKLKVIFSVLLHLLFAGLATGDVRHEINIPDILDYKTLKCDLHIHTVFSDGLVRPTVRVDEAWREGPDAISITDHIEYQPHKLEKASLSEGTGIDYYVYNVILVEEPCHGSVK